MRRADLAVEIRREVRCESCVAEFCDKETGLNLGGGDWDVLECIEEAEAECEWRIARPGSWLCSVLLFEFPRFDVELVAETLGW